MLYKRIKKSGPVVWSPIPKYKSLLILGTNNGVINDDFQNESKLIIFDTRRSENRLKTINPLKISEVNSNDSFSCLEWGLFDNKEMGIIVGGLCNGGLVLGETEKMMKNFGKSFEFDFVENCDYIPTCLAISSGDNSSDYLAVSVRSDPNVIVFDLNQMGLKNNKTTTYTPKKLTSRLNSNVTTLKWNQKVPHILSTGSTSGTTTVWDLRQHKSVMSLKSRDASSSNVNAISWNPTQALQLVVAYNNPVGEIWDLRNIQKPHCCLTNSNDKPLVAAEWNSFDPRILMTIASNGYLSYWETSGAELFSQMTNTKSVVSANWASCEPSFISMATDDLTTEILSAEYIGDKIQPDWSSMKTSLSFSSTGNLISLSEKDKTIIRINPVKMSVEISGRALEFEEKLSESNLEGVCEEMSEKSINSEDKMVWDCLKILAEKSDSKKFLKTLGFEDYKEEVNVEPAKTDTNLNLNNAEKNVIKNESEQIDAAAFFDSISMTDNSIKMKNDENLDKNDVNLIEQKPIEIQKDLNFDDDNGEFDSIKKSLICGNFQSAVEKCIKMENFADALIISRCSPDIWQKTQSQYLSTHKNRFMRNIMSHVICHDIDHLANNSNLELWRETLAIILNHSQKDSFVQNCNVLAQRLETHGNNFASLICYLVASNTMKTTEKILNRGDNDLQSFQTAFEKILIFSLSTGDVNNEYFQSILAKYFKILLSNGNQSLVQKYFKRLNIKTIENESLHFVLIMTGQTPKSSINRKPLPSKPLKSKPIRSSHHNQPIKSHKPLTKSAINKPSRLTNRPSTPIKPKLPPKFDGNNNLISPEEKSIINWRNLRENKLKKPSKLIENNSSPTNFPSKPKPIENTTTFGDKSINKLTSLAVNKQNTNLMTVNPRENPSTDFTKSLTSLSSRKNINGDMSLSRPVLKPLSSPNGIQNDVKSFGGEKSLIMERLIKVLELVGSKKLMGMEKRKIKEIYEKFEILKSKLVNGKIKGMSLSNLEQLSEDVEKGDFVSAKQRHGEMMTDEWVENKDWLGGVYTLILLAKRHCKS